MELISQDFPSLFNLTQKKFIELLISISKKIMLKNFKKYKPYKNFTNDYIKYNYNSLKKNPLINKKNILLLNLFTINSKFAFLFFLNHRYFQKYYRYHIKTRLPLIIQDNISIIINSLNQCLKKIRIQKIPTQILGPKYQRSRKFIEIDITYKCNLKCHNCDRSCSQAPSNKIITLKQIKRFLDECINKNIKWERIRILGGEPTLHPDLLKIIDMMRNWRSKYSPKTIIQIVTNGFGQPFKEMLRLIPDDIIIINSNKNSRKQLFNPFNLAPCDQKEYRFSDFRNGCNIIEESGIGFSPYGYYPCAPAGAIDRVFGFDIGRKKLPPKYDNLDDQLNKLCRFCGHFTNNFNLKVNKPIISKSWKEAYKLYNKEQPILKLYE
jgi:hypothetical protein